MSPARRGAMILLLLLLWIWLECDLETASESQTAHGKSLLWNNSLFAVCVCFVCKMCDRDLRGCFWGIIASMMVISIWRYLFWKRSSSPQKAQKRILTSHKSHGGRWSRVAEVMHLELYFEKCGTQVDYGSVEVGNMGFGVGLWSWKPNKCLAEV